MKLIAQPIYSLLIWLDRISGNYEAYHGETAPYCGHGYNGHKGYFTQSHFHESDGGGESKGWFSRYIVGVWYSNVDGQEYGFSFPLYNFLRYLYYESKYWLKNLNVKIDYPYGKRTLYIHTRQFRSYRFHRLGYMRKSTLHIIRLKRGFIPCSHDTISI